jgi:hypothetical protein
VVADADALDAGTGRAEVMTREQRARVDALTLFMNVVAISISLVAILLAVLR